WPRSTPGRRWCSLRTLGPSGLLLTVPALLTEHSGPKYTQHAKPSHWSDPTMAPRGSRTTREQRRVRSGTQELSKENEAVYQENGNPSFLSIPSACNCQGTPGIPEGPYSEGGDGSSSQLLPPLYLSIFGEDEELEEEKDVKHLSSPLFSHVVQRKETSIPETATPLSKKEDSREGLRRDPRSPGRHRSGRKRSQTDKRRGLGLWGKYVETCGHLIYACRQLKSSDLDLFRVWVGVWTGWLGGWAQVMFQFLSQGFYYGLSLFTRFLRLLGALLLLALTLFLGFLQLGWRFLVGLGDRLGWRNKAIWLFSWLDSPALQRCMTLLRDSRPWQQLVRTVQWAGWSALGSSRVLIVGRYCQPEEEVARLLTMAGVPEDELNPFHATASDVELKKAYRQLAVMVHPDKNHHPRAEEAFKVLRAAWDIVSNAEKRKEYEMKRMAENELSRSVNEFLSKLQDDLKEAMNTMMCSRCQGKHRRFEMDRELKSARYCAKCNRLHPAEEGDFWAESSMLGLKITYFAVMDGKVYDITEWAGCQRVGISPDTHRVPYHISFGSRIPGNSGRQRATPDAPPADLQDFLSRIFQVPPGQMPNGNFFAAPQPGPGATAASKPNSTVPKGEAKTKRRKKVRRPFQR
uniref:DnaJ heat shock protein family (Hsp40) member C14 n=1 Tax=Aotus nancymaae TaxID=37293 RepID=A0A2K5CWL0_AOTNA